MSNRFEEPGWIRIGRTDGRRSLWIRTILEHIPASDYTSSDGIFCLCECETAIFYMRVIAIELCSGREGDDSYTKIARASPAFAELWNVFKDQLWAVELIEGQEVEPTEIE